MSASLSQSVLSNGLSSVVGLLFTISEDSFGSCKNCVVAVKSQNVPQAV